MFDTLYDSDSTQIIFKIIILINYQSGKKTRTKSIISGAIMSVFISNSFRFA